jgi:hypothetical protein
VGAIIGIFETKYMSGRLLITNVFMWRENEDSNN